MSALIGGVGHGSRANVGIPALRYRDQYWSSEELAAVVASWHAVVLERCPSHVRLTATVMSNHPEAVAVLLALSALPLPVVLLPPDPRAWRTDPPLPESTMLVLSPASRQFLPAAEELRVQVGALEAPRAGGAAFGETPILAGPGLVHFTSGSSGLPKPVYRDTGARLQGVAAFADALGIPPGSSVLGTLPLAWGYGLNSTLLLAALRCSELLLLDRFDHRAALHAFATWRPWFWPATPLMVDLLARCLLDGPAPAGPRCCTVGGDRLSESTAALFRDRFGTVLRPTYGSTESGPITVNSASPSDIRSDCVGPPLRGVEVRIGEDPQRPLESAMPGRIWIKPAAGLTGYGYPPDVTPLTEVDGWMATADLGTLDRRGALTVIGRVDDAFKTTSGHLVNPTHIEGTLRRCTGVTAAAVVRLPHQDGALIGALVEGIGPSDLATVRAEVARLLPGWSQPEPLLATKSLPRLANGKIDYRRCAAILGQGTADA